MGFYVYTGICSITFLAIHFSARAMSMPHFGWRDGLVFGWAITFIPVAWLLVWFDVVILPSIISAIVVGLAWRSIVPAIGILTGCVLAILVSQGNNDSVLLLAPAVWLASYALGCWTIVGLRRLRVSRFEVEPS